MMLIEALDGEETLRPTLPLGINCLHPIEAGVLPQFDPQLAFLVH
jgi:hypothetical protein